MDWLQEREQGAALVETAFVLVLLMMILVGIVTVGVAFNRSNGLQTAAREGSRYGATLTVQTDMTTYLDDVRDVTKAAAIGDLDASVPGQYICVALVDSSYGSQSLVESGGGETSGTTCFTDGRSDPRVQVVVRRDSDIEVVVFSQTVTLEGTSVSRYERD